MSKYSEYLKSLKTKDMEFFFNGGYKMTSNKYFTFTSVVDDDNIIIVTNNVKYWFNKDQYVLFVADDKVVYLKDWQIKPVRNFYLGVEAYAVKLNKKYFKPYQIHYEQDEFVFEKEDTFDDLFKLANEQQSKNTIWALN